MVYFIWLWWPNTAPKLKIIFSCIFWIIHLRKHIVVNTNHIYPCLKSVFFSVYLNYAWLYMHFHYFILFYFFDWTDLCPIFQSQPTDKENKMTLSDTFMWNLTGLLRMQRLVREELVVRPERKDDIYSFSGTKTRPNAAIPLGGFDHMPWLQANRFDVRWEGRGELWVRD